MQFSTTSLQLAWIPDMHTHGRIVRLHAIYPELRSWSFFFHASSCCRGSSSFVKDGSFLPCLYFHPRSTHLLFLNIRYSRRSLHHACLVQISTDSSLVFIITNDSLHLPHHALHCLLCPFTICCSFSLSVPCSGTPCHRASSLCL